LISHFGDEVVDTGIRHTKLPDRVGNPQRRKVESGVRSFVSTHFDQAMIQPLTRCFYVLAILFFAVVDARGQAGKDWISVGGDRGCTRYSTLDQINRSNIDQLELSWTFRTGELVDGKGRTIECTPVAVDGVVYITTANRRVIALHGESGEILWEFDPAQQGPPAGPLASGGVNRGVAYWSDGKANGQRRILHGTSDGRLFCLDAATGRPDPNFADRGAKDLREDIDRDISRLGYGPTSAPAVCGDVVILGVSNGEGPGLAAPGDVRAFDVRSGRQVWRFHTVPRPGEVGHETWKGDSWINRGGANAWGGASVDTERGLVFAALGSAAFDFYGGDRHGDNLFANCVVALDAKTGQRRWHFQTLRHDLWDHDLPVYPNLVTVVLEGQSVDAVAQVTKTGFVYLLDRETGRSLFPIRELAVPASDVPGERAAATQPIPTRPPPFSAQFLDETNVTTIGEANREFILKRLATLRGGKAFHPPSLQGTVVVPGFHGGANWSGASFDPTTEILYVNSTNLPNIIQLTPSQPGSRYRYAHKGYERFYDQEGYPGIRPPWGQLNAIDLGQGDFAWRAILGEHPELTARGIEPTGTENFGGSIVTAGGLVFIGGTKDERFRAFDKSTGTLLWETQLDAGAYATPSTYEAAGKQYVIIAAGGAGKQGTRAGDAFYAFALPNSQN
jgi:quinoprotein glucose dehydrogenase